MKRLTTLFIALALVGIVQAEETTLQGTVIDQDGNPIEGAIVSCSLLGYDEGELLDKIETRTEKNGSFTLKFDDEKGLPSFLITAPGYTPFEASSGADFLYPRKQSVIKKIIILYNAINYVTGVRSTIVLPVTPDASLGRYFRYDRQDEGKVIFEREYSPQANIPYVIIPNRDFTVDISEMDLTKEIQNTIAPIATYEDSFIGSYSSIAYQTLDESHDYWPIDEMGDEFPTEQNDTISYMPKAMHAALILHFLTYLANDFEVVFHDPDEDYTPFVAKGKQWHVLKFSEGPAIPYDYEFGQSESVIDGKTYYPLYLKTGEGTNWEKSLRFYLFREEDRRVYLYDYETAQEYCVYDFTLEVGDTFDIGIGDEAKQCVVTKVDHINVKGEELKTITFSSVNVSPTYGCEPLHINHTWVEGVGDLSEPTAGWKPNSYESSWSYHVAYMFMPEYNPDFYPFSFCDTSNDNYGVIGQDLVRGEKLPDDTTSDEDELSYEIVDEKLHVTGTMWMQCGPNNYIYCKLKPSDTYNTYQITLQKEEVEPLMDCISSYVVDLYFNLPYYLVRDVESFVYVDSEGEHPVPNRDKYHPFIEDGKVWKTGRVTMPGVPAFDVNYYYLEGDTVIKSEQYQKLMRTNVTKERKVTVYNGALREEGKKVYYSGGLLYDFDAQIGDTLEVYGFPNTKAIIEKRDVVDLNGYTVRRTLLGVYGLDEENEYGIINHDAWYEGIGYQAGPCEGLDPGYLSGMYFNTLLSCTIYNDTLYSDARYTDAVSEYWDEDSETKKQKIDFTHVIKTKPTSPRVAANISLLWGEYSNAVLNIDFEGMNGRYRINVRKDGEQQDRFSANQETHNLQSLDVNLAGYPDGDYTVVVENDEESYTAHFSLPLDGTGIESIHSEFVNGKSSNGKSLYDLSGRRIVNPKRGLYIQGGRKVLIE